MEWQGWLTLVVVGLTLVVMIREIAKPDLVLMAGLFTLAAAGVLTPAETFAGFANPALATVGLELFLTRFLNATIAITSLQLSVPSGMS